MFFKLLDKYANILLLLWKEHKGILSFDNFKHLVIKGYMTYIKRINILMVYPSDLHLLYSWISKTNL